MKNISIIVPILGLVGVIFGAFGAHGIRGHISDQHYDAYRTGIMYLFYHMAPLFYIISRQKSRVLNVSALFFMVGILFFTGSNILMTTEEMHHINFHFLWPVTPLGGVLLILGWTTLAYYHVKS